MTAVQQAAAANVLSYFFIGAVFMTPTWIALGRSHPQRLAIFALNACGALLVMVGQTAFLDVAGFPCMIAALVWSLIKRK